MAAGLPRISFIFSGERVSDSSGGRSPGGPATVVVVYGIELNTLVPLLLATVAATVGVAATGTLYGVLAAGLRVRETLVPVLLLPVVAPVLLGATRSWEAAIDGAPSDAWPWVALLAVFAVLFTGIGMLAFGPLLEEA